MDNYDSMNKPMIRSSRALQTTEIMQLGKKMTVMASKFWADLWWRDNPGSFLFKATGKFLNIAASLHLQILIMNNLQSFLCKQTTNDKEIVFRIEENTKTLYIFLLFTTYCFSNLLNFQFTTPKMHRYWHLGYLGKHLHFLKKSLVFFYL